MQRLRKIRGCTATALLLAVAGAAVGEDQDCTHLWDGERAPIVIAPTTDVPAAVAIHGLLTEAAIFFHPSTVQESNCALDLILSAGLRDALREGVKQFLAADVSESPEEAYEQLIDSLEKSLGALDAANPGWDDSFNRILLVFDWQYGIRGAEDSNESLLTNQARDLGIYFTGNVSQWLLVSYLEHLVPRFDIALFVGVLQSRDADVAPPRTLSVEDCPQELVYRWPTASQPYTSFAQAWADHDVVHWGICQQLNTLWVYHYKDGWRAAQPNEPALVCSEHGGSSPIAEFCQRAGINVR